MPIGEFWGPVDDRFRRSNIKCHSLVLFVADKSKIGRIGKRRKRLSEKPETGSCTTDSHCFLKSVRFSSDWYVKIHYNQSLAVLRGNCVKLRGNCVKLRGFCVTTRGNCVKVPAFCVITRRKCVITPHRALLINKNSDPELKNFESPEREIGGIFVMFRKGFSPAAQGRRKKFPVVSRIIFLLVRKDPYDSCVRYICC